MIIATHVFPSPAIFGLAPYSAIDSRPAGKYRPAPCATIGLFPPFVTVSYIGGQALQCGAVKTALKEVESK